MTYFRSKHIAELNILTVFFNEDSCFETDIGCACIGCASSYQLFEFTAQNECVSCKLFGWPE